MRSSVVCNTAVDRGVCSFTVMRMVPECTYVHHRVPNECGYTQRMVDMQSLYDAHKDLPEDAQKQAGQAIAGDMKPEHVAFLQLVVKLIDDKQMDPYTPETLLNKNVYDALTDEWKAKVDYALMNISTQLRRIYEFYKSTATPDSSLQLQTDIDHLWQMKNRIERHGDIFKF